MSDKYKIDSHKLIYHPERVAEYLATGDCYPIYMELSPSGACNHRCNFCGLDFMGYQARFLDYDVLKLRLPEMAKLGVKSIMHGGEGEPLLNKKFADILICGKESGIDQAITTNGVLLSAEIAERILGHTEWIKVSINAGDSPSYDSIHRGKAGDFERVIANISKAVEIRSKENYKCTIGMQMILLPENRATVKNLAQTARDIGADYLVIKPYSQHTNSETRIYEDINYEDDLKLGAELQEYNTEAFKVIFRAETMQNWDDSEIAYEKCLALPFWSYIDAGGNVWGCSIFLTDARFCYGNINDSSFEEIWQGQKRKQHLEMMKNDWDITACRINCRMDKINRYLRDLKNPIAHVNFI